VRERKRRPSPRRTPPPPTDPDIEQRLADIQRDLLAKAQAARERAQRAAREAAANYKRPSDEELGYIKTDDTFGKIMSDARQELADRLGHVREEPVKDRVADLLDQVAAVLRGEHSGPGEKTEDRRG
jgi:vacuolar-type H+-ATPase subunit E/Vma4